MKFAVVEYISKTGRIWKHTDARPNYLADPVKEIDPTSFGCYVSALKGEHVPLKGLIIGDGISAPAKFYRRAYKKLFKRWPKYDLSYCQQFDAILAVHQLSDADEMARFVQRLKKMSPRPIIVGVPTQPHGILKDAFATDSWAQAAFKDFMDATDVFVSVVKDTVDWYQSQTKTQVVYLPQPYPVEYARQFARPLSGKEPIILVAGVTQRQDIRKGQAAARALQQRHPEYRILVPKVEDMDYDFSNLYGSRYEVLPFELWQDHLKTLSRCRLIINTDYTQTRGRVQVDAAAVGTLSVGSDSDGQRDLFPELMGKPADNVPDLIGQCDRLLLDDSYYQQLAERASQHLTVYNYEHSATRFEALINSLKS